MVVQAGVMISVIRGPGSQLAATPLFLLCSFCLAVQTGSSNSLCITADRKEEDKLFTWGPILEIACPTFTYIGQNSSHAKVELFLTNAPDKSALLPGNKGAKRGRGYINRALFTGMLGKKPIPLIMLSLHNLNEHQHMENHSLDNWGWWGVWYPIRFEKVACKRALWRRLMYI